MYCPDCGTVMRQDAQFCERCGKRQDLPVGPASRAQSRRHFRSKRRVWLFLLFVASVAAIGIQIYDNRIPAHQTTGQQETPTAQTPDEEFEQSVNVLVTTGHLSRSEAERSVRLGIQNQAKALAAREPDHLHPPKFLLYKSKTSGATSYVVPLTTTNEELKTLLWFFRRKVRSRAFAQIGITKPTSKNWGKYNYNYGIFADLQRGKVRERRVHQHTPAR